MGADDNLAHHHQPSHPQATKPGANWPDPVPNLLISLLSAPDLVSAGVQPNLHQIESDDTNESLKTEINIIETCNLDYVAPQSVPAVERQSADSETGVNTSQVKCTESQDGKSVSKHERTYNHTKCKAENCSEHILGSGYCLAHGDIARKVNIVYPMVVLIIKVNVRWKIALKIAKEVGIVYPMVFRLGGVFSFVSS
uniref:Uncharacterized protein n=1 Tax=Timema bartmani TaxID=61472 RepID=A0A7R9F6U7_9NEOP|nr:unnamed protein product [Timema bartmani]